MPYRTERDALGRVKVPSDAYYGAETARALSNFKISGTSIQKELIHSYAILKKASAVANMRCGKLDREREELIIRVCNEIIAGKLDSQFNVDVFQAGAGTSINMNINEVIANRALELMKKRKGQYNYMHPNDHVNMSQSTNDTFPSVIRIATYSEVHKKLLPALRLLQKVLESKSNEFSKVVKVGRTHLQDAVPMTMGEEFSGYAGEVEHLIEDVEKASGDLLELPIGGSAVGTGINVPKGYQQYAIAEICRLTHYKFRKAQNMFGTMQNRIAELDTSNAIKECAIALNKIANDIRLLGSGPRAGFGDIVLPAVQPGSSIMPGKVNPSIAEMLNMICFEVIGGCETVEQAVESGQLELNVFMPIIAYRLLYSISILSNGIRTFAERCIKGIKANQIRINEELNKNLMLATALTPYIGYSKAAKIAVQAYKQNKTIKEVCMQMHILDKKKLDGILDPKKLV